MSYTSFGEFVRILRIQHHEVMGDMAKLLKVSPTFLSAVENGKKNVPRAWPDIIAAHYNLTPDDVSRLQQSIQESKTQMKLNLIGQSPTKKEMALQVARSFDDLDDETAQKIINILGGKSF